MASDRGESLKLVVKIKFVDLVELTAGVSIFFGTIGKDVGDFFSDAVFLGDMEVAHEVGRFEKALKYK
jgi:hypothetical protein